MSVFKTEQGSKGAEVQGSKNSPLLPRSPAPLHRISILSRDGLVLILFALLTLLMTNPLVLHIANAVEDKQDGLLNVWIIASVGHALITDPLNLFNANIFYPYPNTLAFSETLLPQGLFALPFNLAFDNTVLGYNLVLLASFFLAAYAMYLFVFDLTRSRGAGIVAGTIFAFNPYNLGNLAQVQLLSFGWMPLVFLYLRRLLLKSTVNSQQSTVNSRFSIFDFRLCFLFAIFFSLQALSSFYYAFLAGFAAALYILYFLVMQYTTRTTLHTPLFTVYRSLFTRLVISAALITLVVVPFFIPYLQVQQQMGFERKVSESEPFSASLKLYTQVSPQNVLYSNLLAPRPPIMNGGYPLDNLFPGIIAIALAIVGIIASQQRDKWFYFILLAFAFLLSLGPRLFLAPNIGTDITLPYRWLYDIFPLMKALRAPVRFDAVVMFALAVLAGLGLQKAVGSRQNAENKLLPTAYCLLLTCLIALEYLALPAAQITPVPVWNEIPAYVRWLRQQPPGVILELPMIASDPSKPLDLTTQYLSTYHWHTTPDGYSGFNPPRRGEIAYEMQFFPGERAISLLQALTVESVLVHSHQIADWKTMRQTIDRTPELQLANQFGDDYIYRIATQTQDASLLSARLYLPQPATINQTYFAYIVVYNRAKSNYAIKPTDTWQIDVQWNEGTKQTIAASLPLVLSSASVIPVRLTAPSQPGTYRLNLVALGKATGSWNLSDNVTVQESEGAHEVVIPATAGLQTMLQSHYAPGENLMIDVVWTPYNKIDAYYSASVRVVDANGNKIVAQDREPLVSTFLWTPGVPVQDRFVLKLPSELVPGNYSIQVMLYQADQGIDALLLDWDYIPQETITLGTFTVK